MNIYDFNVKDSDDNEISLSDYNGKVLLIVNTATGCGFTPQYKGLEYLYEKYKDKGFEILDFPCNQFLGQAPGTNEEIVSFCQLNYGVSFKTFAKIEVNGENAHPLYKYLKSVAPDDIDNGEMDGFREHVSGKYNHKFEEHEIQWNFTKFLIDQDGNMIGRYSSSFKPEELDDKIAAILK